ncbi:MAG: FtsX-like permease family protein [Candidatus Thorarchaeota archaeon]
MTQRKARADNAQDKAVDASTREIPSENLKKYPPTKFSFLDAFWLALANARFQKGSLFLSLAGIILTTAFLSYLLVSSFVLSDLGLEGVQDYFWWVLLVSLIICFIGINYTVYTMTSRRSFELGTFSALGGRWQHVLKVLFLDSILIGILGGFLGGAFGILIGTYALADEHGIEIVVDSLLTSQGEFFLLETFLTCLIVSTLFTVVSTIYPFLTIVLRSPADTIRSDI